MDDREPIKTLPAGVAEKLGYYVYLYIDPRTGRPFYVGKGKGGRVLSHLSDLRESLKTKTIAELRAAGMTPRLDILSHGLKDEEAAFRIEAAAIDLLGLGELTNAVRGWKSLQVGRMSLSELMGYYAAPAVEVTDPALLIRINKLFRHSMSETELYEATRGIWKLGSRRANVKLALAVFEGVVREVYQIHTWHPGRTTPYTTRNLSERDARGRWEFVGSIAQHNLRLQYRGKNVRKYFRQGLQSPTIYVNA